jgi:hypothetical protein
MTAERMGIYFDFLSLRDLDGMPIVMILLLHHTTAYQQT